MVDERCEKGSAKNQGITINKNRNILLLEPNYKNKYPPIGLMKIATYHRLIGDNVTFYKGDLNSFVFERNFKKCLTQLKINEPAICWDLKHTLIKEFLKRKDASLFDEDDFKLSQNKPLIKHTLNQYRNSYLNRFSFKKDLFTGNDLWDRVYVTTLFTFHWKVTIETIEFAKNLVADIGDVKVGGVMASLMPLEIEQATGIKPMQGLLDRPFMLDKDVAIIVDDLPLDYSILHEIDYEYPVGSAYITFMSKGCTRTCKFCAVPKLEPNYKGYVPTVDKFKQIARYYGEQQHLLLMDNNILASDNLNLVINEIKQMGFTHGSAYIEPNLLRIGIRNLRLGFNDNAYIRHTYKLIHKLGSRLRGQVSTYYKQVLVEHDLQILETATKSNLIAAYPKIAKIYEKYRTKTPRQRFVDFNQGIDCRYITEEKMQLLSELPIRPLRIAFDYLKLEEQYTYSVRLAVKYGFKEFSNYILFNFIDTPEEFYKRLEINDNLSKELGVHIYSFPMKYIPLYGEDAKSRSYVGKHWNRKFIRAIQCMLNVTKGIVAHSVHNKKGDFFRRAFGNDLQDFFELLYMPEAYIIYRTLCEELGYTQEWLSLFRRLSEEDVKLIKPVIENNDLNNFSNPDLSTTSLKLLNHYNNSRDFVTKAKGE